MTCYKNCMMTLPNFLARNMYGSDNVDDNHFFTKTRPCNILQFFNVKKDNFQMKKNVIFFLIFAQNIDCGYTLEPPQ